MTDATERRAPVQGEQSARNLRLTVPGGTIAWSEHLEAYVTYARLYGASQTAERIAERGGFGLFELCYLLGHPPHTWEPR